MNAKMITFSRQDNIIRVYYTGKYIGFFRFDYTSLRWLSFVSEAKHLPHQMIDYEFCEFIGE